MFKKILPAIACTAALLMSGCAFSGSGVVSTSGSTSPLSKGNMGGVAHGGRQGIYNATVSLYAMNTSTANYGDTPIMYAQTKTLDANGTFAFVKGADGSMTTLPTTLSGNSLPAWSCPAGASTGTPGSATDPYMYLVASGGDTSGTGNIANNNTYAKLLLVLGDCASIYPTELVTINEATTVASMVALQQFFNPATQAIGAPTTNTLGLTNAVNMISNLVVNSTGEFQTSVTYTASPTSSAAGVTVVAAPEGSKLSTMANILAACVSSIPSVSSTSCTALSNNAVPPTIAPAISTGNATTESSAITNFSAITTYPTVTDTLQAIDYMLINPTNSQDYGSTGRLNNLYALSTTGTQPFGAATGSTSPAPLTTQPADWTVGINFTSTGSCTNATYTQGAVTSPLPWLYDLYFSAVDANGNVWMSGYGGSTTSTPNAMYEVSPVGAPLQCITSATTGNSAGRQSTFDSHGNLWWVTNQGLIEFLGAAGSTSAAPPTILTWSLPTGYSANSVVADVSGNIFINPYAAISTAGTNAGTTLSVYEYPNAASATTANAVTPVAIGNTLLSVTPVPYRNMTVNLAGALVTEGSGSTGGYAYAYQPNSNASAVGGFLSSKVSTTGGASSPYGLAVDLNGYSIGGNTVNARAGGLYRIDPTFVSGTTVGTMKNYSTWLGVGGQNVDRSVAIDGAGNIWTGGGPDPDDSNTGTLNVVGESDANYYAISPQGNTPGNATYPDTCTAAGTTNAADNSPCATGGGYQKSWLLDAGDNMWNIAIDSSGNVWSFEGSASQQEYFTIIGQAVPVKTPLIANIH